MQTRDLHEMSALVSEMQKLAGELMDKGAGMPVVKKNVKRMTSSLDILRQNVNDLAPRAGGR